MKWIRFTTKEDKKQGYSLCPICKSELDWLIDEEDIAHQEKCIKGCYIYDFDKNKRIK